MRLSSGSLNFPPFNTERELPKTHTHIYIYIWEELGSKVNEEVRSTMDVAHRKVLGPDGRDFPERMVFG